ncbi:MAG: PilZ protein [Proteobacteria bacterium]|nr:PilZ protein [Pseudomonadota bacterium]
MEQYPSELDRLIAAELDHARDLLVMMGDELAMSPEIVAEHGMALQAVDIVGQMIGHLANVVRAEDRKQAIDRIGMCELKAKLGAA